MLQACAAASERNKAEQLKQTSKQEVFPKTGHKTGEGNLAVSGEQNFDQAKRKGQHIKGV